TLNADGELVGLLFDGNYESLNAGWIFNPELTRSIHVDTRYMRWLMDAVDHAEHLLAAMGLPHDCSQRTTAWPAAGRARTCRRHRLRRPRRRGPLAARAAPA